MYYELLTIVGREVMDDVRAAAFLESELHPELDRHRRHEMADICERDNVERVWRVLGVAVAEVRVALIRILESEKALLPVNLLQRPAAWRFRFQFPIPKTIMIFLREKIHEYLVAAAMADRTATIIPAASAIWQRRMEDAISELRGISNTMRPPGCPARRPLFPF